MEQHSKPQLVVSPESGTDEIALTLFFPYFIQWAAGCPFSTLCGRRRAGNTHNPYFEEVWNTTVSFEQPQIQFCVPVWSSFWEIYKQEYLNTMFFLIMKNIPRSWEYPTTGCLYYFFFSCCFFLKRECVCMCLCVYACVYVCMSYKKFLAKLFLA